MHEQNNLFKFSIDKLRWAQVSNVHMKPLEQIYPSSKFITKMKQNHHQGFFLLQTQWFNKHKLHNWNTF